MKSAPDHFLFRGQVLGQHVAGLGSRSKWRSSLRVVRYKSCIVYRIRQEWECQMYSLYAEAYLFAFFVFRVVASLTGPGGQEFHFPYFFLKFWSIFLIFPQTVLIFFLILTLRVGDCPPGLATPHIFNIQFLNSRNTSCPMTRSKSRARSAINIETPAPSL